MHRELDLLRMKESNLKDMQVTFQSCHIIISSKHHIIIIIQALATDEAETICKLEKRNFELVELQKKLENKMEVEREKLKRALDNAKKESELLKILVNELHREIEGKDDQIKEIGTQLAETKDDVLKLEEANSRLKGQVLVCAQWHHSCQFKYAANFCLHSTMPGNFEMGGRSRGGL